MPEKHRKPNLGSERLENDQSFSRTYEIRPFSEPKIKSDLEVDIMIIQITEEIIEKVVDKAYVNHVNCKSVSFFMQCFKEAWRRVVTWSTYTLTNAGMPDNWKGEAEPHISPLDPYCSYVTDKREREIEDGQFEELRHEEARSEESQIRHFSEVPSIQVQKKAKKKKRRKKKLASTEEKENVPSVARTQTSISKSHTKSTYTRSMTSSMAFGDYRENIKKKYVKQLAKFISAKNFPKQMVKGGMRVHTPFKPRELRKTYKAVVINVKELQPDVE